MSGRSRSTAGSFRSWPPRFRGGVGLAIAFVLAFSLWLVVSNGARLGLLGSDPAVVSERLLGIASSTVQIGLAVAFLRYEGVRLRDIGLRRQLLARALVAVGGLLVVVNTVVAALVVTAGSELTVGLFALYRSPPLELSPAAIAASSVYYYLFVGPAEELAFRGYLQNKVVDVLGGRDDRVRVALGVVTAAVVFSVMHVPAVLVVHGVGLDGLVGPLVVTAFTGLAFGTIYELTGNLYLVMFLHGIGDFWPLVVDSGPVAWPNWGVLAGCYALLVVLYRRWEAGEHQKALV